MTALQLKYFGKGHSVRHKKGKVGYIAKKRRSRSVYAKKARSGGRSMLGGLGGIKTIIAPLVGGAGDAFLAGKIPVDGVASTVSGFVLGDKMTRQIGLYQVGRSGANMFIGGQGFGSSGGFI